MKYLLTSVLVYTIVFVFACVIVFCMCVEKIEKLLKKLKP